MASALAFAAALLPTALANLPSTTVRGSTIPPSYTYEQENTPITKLGPPAIASIISTPASVLQSSVTQLINSSKLNSSSKNDFFSNLWPEINNMSDIVGLGCAIAMIFGGIVPYIPQYLTIRRTLNSEGFSTYVCLTLLLANIMRISFWFGHEFERPLLIQSFVMIFAMLAIMQLCVQVKDKEMIYGMPRRFSLFGKITNTDSESAPIYSVSRYSLRRSAASNSSSLSLFSQSVDDSITNIDTTESSNSESHSRTNLFMRTNETSYKYFDTRDFWQWDDFASYLKFLALFSFVLAMLTYIFIVLDYRICIEILGFLALFTESILGAPQLIKNHRKKSTRGMSIAMVAMWLSGDVFKTGYFIIRNLPLQFWFCGSIQVLIDLLILGQVLCYRKPHTLTDIA